MEAINLVVPNHLSSYQRRWIIKVQEHIWKYSATNLANLSVADIAIEMQVSERQFYRLVKKNLNITPNALIQNIKLEKAKLLLENGTFSTVSEIAYESGFNQPAYFSNLFLKNYGKRPKEYLCKKT